MKETLWKRIVKSIDLFSIPILFLFQHRPIYGTLYGGLLTLLIWVFMLIYLIILVFNPWTNTNINNERNLSSEQIFNENSQRHLATANMEFELRTSETSYPLDSVTSGNPINPFNDGFMLAIQTESGFYDEEMFFFLCKYSYIFFILPKNIFTYYLYLGEA